MTFFDDDDQKCLVQLYGRLYKKISIAKQISKGSKHD